MRGLISCPECTLAKKLIDNEAEPEILGEIDGEAIKIWRYHGDNPGATLISGPWLKVSCGNPQHNTPVFYAGAKPMPTTRLNCTALYIGHMYNSGIPEFLKDVLSLGVFTPDELIAEILKLKEVNQPDLSTG